MPKFILLLAAVWLASGVLAGGWWWRWMSEEFPNSYHTRRQAWRVIVYEMVAAGPFAFIPAVFSRTWEHGWEWPR
jgi:hypothetical protein